MELMLVIQQVIILFLLMVVGYYATKNDILNQDINKGMTGILMHIALPALIISSFDFKYSKNITKGIITMLIYSLSVHIINIIISKILFGGFNKKKNVILKFGIVFANSGFMGLPLILELLGQEGVLYATIFMIPYYILLWTYGQKILSGKRKVFSLKKTLQNPALLAIIIGIFIFIMKIRLPYIINRPLEMLASFTTPLSMLIIGGNITKIEFKEIVTDKGIYYGCFVRLIILPLITFTLLTIINAPDLLKEIVVIMQSLPTAILLVIFTQKYDGDINFASKFTILSHIMSIITIPIIIITISILK